MKAGWQSKPLGEVCKTGSGGTPLKSRKEFYENGTIPWLMSGEVSQGEVHEATRFITKKGLENSSARIFPINTVLVAMYGATAGQVGILKFEASTNQAVCGILPSEQFIPEFLYYFFLSKKDALISQATGNAQPNISQIKIKNISVPIINLDQQQRIVAILDQAFEGIAKARTNAEQNLQNARALFESHLQSVFTERGEGWVKKKLGETSILKIIDGDRGINYPSKEEFSDDGFCLFLNTKNVRPDGFNFDTTMFISEKKDKVLRNGKLQRQDVILTTRGTIGNVAIFDANVEFENIRINSGMLIFRPNKEKLLSSFLFEVFRSSIMKDQMIRHVSGAAQPQLPIKTLIDFEIPVPDTLESQREIVASVREIDAETRRLGAIYQRKLTLLDELKKSLLQQAFAGEL